jgi:hypothetical protein
MLMLNAVIMAPNNVPWCLMLASVQRIRGQSFQRATEQQPACSMASKLAGCLG